MAISADGFVAEQNLSTCNSRHVDQMEEEPTARELATLSLLSLPWTLIGLCWPAERVVVGQRTCRALRNELHSYAQKILLVRSAKSQMISEVDLVRDLARFSQTRVSLKWEYLNSPCEILLNAMKSANFMSALRQLRLKALLFADTPLLTRTLTSCVGLIHLDLAANEMGPEGMGKLAPALAACKQLEHLNLSRNDLRDSGASQLATILGECHALIHLNLWWNEIGPAGAGKLASALLRCNSLAVLNLSLNQIADEGARVLGEALRGSSTLRDLNLYGNGIGDLGAAHLGGALQGCYALERLDVTMNAIGDAGEKRLADLVQECKTLIHHTAFGRRWYFANGDAACADRGDTVATGITWGD